MDTRLTRVIATVADKRVERQLADFVKSLRVHGWTGKVLVYSPVGSVPALPAGCASVQFAAWWAGVDLGGAKNTAAFLKPQIFIDAQLNIPDGSQVAYFDCSDIVVMCDPHRIFDCA